MMNTFRIKQYICAKIFLVLVFGLLAPTGFASAEDFIFSDFTVAIKVNEDASLYVTEKIRVNFFTEKHGIYREIPIKYEGRFGENVNIDINVLSVTDEEGNPWEYEVIEEGKNLRIRIGGFDKTVNGLQKYVINYTVDRAISYFDDHDELFWNVTGSVWGVDIPNSAVSITLPEHLLSGVEVVCYTGGYGSVSQDCTAGAFSNIATASAHDYLTVAVAWPKGYVYEPTFFEKLIRFAGDNWVVGIPIVVFIVLFCYWWKFGRDERGRVTIVPEYEPPEGLTTMEVGTLIDAKVHPRDISAGVVDLAVRGFLKIKSQEEKKLLGSKTTYSFEKLREPKEGELKAAETELFNGIFGSKKEVDLDELKDKFYMSRKKINQSLYAQMAAKELFIKNPNTIRSAFIGVGIMVAGVGAVFSALGMPFVVSMVVSGIIIALFGFISPKKTKKGTLAYEHAKGFKMFLEKAEKHRIKWQEKENIFEEYLPYAMVFGVVDKWTEVFADQLKENPSWYEGRPGAFSTGYFVGSLNDFTSSIGNVSSPSSKGAAGGSSGFSGGFSGGGFGGGGGGSW